MSTSQGKQGAATTPAFDARHQRYLRTRAAFDASVAGNDHGQDCERLFEACGRAFEGIALRPANTLSELQCKVLLLDRERIEDGWYRAREAMALLAADAERLLGEL